MQRITMADLQGAVDRLNRLAGTPTAPYVNGKAQPGCYCLDGAYGGWKLSQIVSDSGAQRDILATGFVSKRELYSNIHSFIMGMEAEIRRANEIQKGA